jgi:hypothetical protein
MATKRNRMSKRRQNKYTRKHGGKKGKKWTTAIDAAQKTLKKTGSLKKAKLSLRSQALSNARKLFGTVGKSI